jgi:sec-independent protein translocase protein TatA
MDVLFAMFSPGPVEMMVILAVAVLLFGKRLPEVGRSLGKGLVEFKKGVRGIEDDIDSATTTSSVPTAHDDVDDHDEATAPKFEPPAAEPQAEEVGETSADEESPDATKAESAEA